MKQLTLIRPRIMVTDPKTPLAGMISIVSLMTLKTPIALSMEEIAHNLSLGLGDFLLDKAEVAIIWEGSARRQSANYSQLCIYMAGASHHSHVGRLLSEPRLKLMWVSMVNDQAPNNPAM